MRINWIDILLVVYIVVAFYFGKKRGLSVELVMAISAVFSWITALHFYQGYGDFLHKNLFVDLNVARSIFYALISLGVIILGMFAGKLIKRIMNLSFISTLEAYGGLIAGGIKGIVVSAIIVVSLSLMPVDFVQKEVYTNSLLGNYFVALTPKAHRWMWPKKSASNFSEITFWSQLPSRPNVTKKI